MQQKHLPFKTKSSYKKIVYLANKITPFILCGICSLFILVSEPGCQEHHEMFVGDSSLNKDDQGTEYVTFEENPAKTQQGGLRKKRRAIQPKMVTTGAGPLCQVQFFKTYLAHRPEEMRNSGPFYLAIIEN